MGRRYLSGSDSDKVVNAPRTVNSAAILKTEFDLIKALPINHNRS